METMEIPWIRHWNSRVPLLITEHDVPLFIFYNLWKEDNLSKWMGRHLSIPVVIVYTQDDLVGKMMYDVKEVTIGVDSIDETSVCKDQVCVVICIIIKILSSMTF